MKNDLHMPRRKWLKLGFGLAAGTLGSGYLLSKNAEQRITATRLCARNWALSLL